MSMAKAGHKSRISRRNGTRLTLATSHAEKSLKEGGEVPMTISGLPCRIAVHTELNMNEKNARILHAKLR